MDDKCPVCETEDLVQLPTLATVRRRYAEAVLRKVNGDPVRAAAVLDVGASTLKKWLKEWREADGASA